MADERNYYVLCENNCKFPAMTKEQILTAIEQAISTGEIKDVDTGFVTRLKEQNANKALIFWIGTTAEYNALTEKKENCFYILTDDTTDDDINASLNEIKNDVSVIGETVGKLNTDFNKTKNDVTLLNNIRERNEKVLLATGGNDPINLEIQNINDYTLVRVSVLDRSPSDILCLVTKTILFDGSVRFDIRGSYTTNDYKNINGNWSTGIVTTVIEIFGTNGKIQDATCYDLFTLSDTGEMVEEAQYIDTITGIM